VIRVLAIAGAALVAACSPQERGATSAPAAIAQTHFPGGFTAGGGTSGDVMARTQAKGANPTEAGTPGIPQGAEGNVGGTEKGGQAGPSSIGGSGEKSSAQSAKGEIAQPRDGAPASPAAR
jgi:hypothetical protein